MNKFNAMIYGLILVGSASLLFIFIVMNILCRSQNVQYLFGHRVHENDEDWEEE